MNNLATIAILEDDRAKSRTLLSGAKGMSEKMSTVKTNMAALDILDGNYSSAESNINGNSFNKGFSTITSR